MVDLYVNTGESPAQIQEIVKVVHDNINQKLVLDKKLEDIQ